LDKKNAEVGKKSLSDSDKNKKLGYEEKLGKPTED